MKKSKSLVLLMLSMMLVVSMAFGGIITVNAADAGTDYNNTYRVGLLEALKISKISGIGITEWTGNLTRGEAAFLVAGLIQLDRSKQSTVFDDVSEEAFYAGSVASLYNSGIVLKAWGSKKFKPDEPIEYGEFLTMICKALGYMGYAESKGGYPVGYVQVAKQFKITKGVSASTDGYVNKQIVPKIIMNALDASYLGLAGIDKDGNIENTEKGVVLNDYFDVYTHDGILTEAGPYSMTNNFQADETQVTVGGINFKISGTPGNYIDLIGQDVVMYFKDDNTAVYAYPKPDNAVITINADDIIPQTTADVLKYYDENDKECKVRLSGSLVTLYNGTKLSGATLEPVYGSVSLVDNDGNGKYDVAKVTEYAVAEVTAVDTYNEIVTFKPVDTAVPTFTLDADKTDKYTMVGTNGKKIKPLTLDVGSIVLYAVNAPVRAENTVYSFVVSKNSVSGKVSADGGDSVSIDGTNYEFSALVERLTASLGDMVTIHIDANGKVFYIKAEGYNYKDTKYAAYLSWDKVKGGTKPKWEIELFTQDGVRVYMDIADKIKINGTKYETKDSHVATFFDSLEQDTIIKYKTANEEFTEIITADDWGSTFKPWEFGKSFNCYTAGTIHWRTNNGGMFASWLPLASDAVRFVIVRDSDGEFNEKRSTVTTTQPGNDQNISNVVLYDIDKAGKAHAYTGTPSDDNVDTGAGSNLNNALLITKVIAGKDADNNEGKFVFGYVGGSIKEYWISSEDYEECGITDSTDPFVVGNLVRIRISGTNIKGIMKSGKNSSSGTPLYYTKAELETADVSSSLKTYDFSNPSVRLSFMMIAKVLYIEDNMVYFVKGSTAADATTVSTSYTYPTNGTVYKLDNSAEGEDRFNVVSWKDVAESTGITSGTDELNGSTVLVNVNSYGITDVIILD